METDPNFYRNMERAHSSVPIVPLSLRALLIDSVDFAGTFPPASLPMAEAVEAYGHHHKSDEAWMLGRFVCQASRLREVTSYFNRFGTRSPMSFCVLASDSRTPYVFDESFERDVEEIQNFRNRYPEEIRIAAVEVKVPGEILASDVIRMAEFVRMVETTLQGRDLQPVDTFFELPIDDNLRQTLPIVTGAILAVRRDGNHSDLGRPGIKIRTGGMKAEAFPTTESVGFVLSACSAEGVRFKATAGMHHPLRQYHESRDTMMHGFLNVFAASVFASQDAVNEKDIVAILNDEEASSFSFTDDEIEWKGRRASLESVERARRGLIVSFGSCSFDDPVQDLRSLGLI